ncbi:hypothetical protein LWF01_13260 [Saxibacter everestensis]|uniref:ABC transmembrane type-1 domain-containing protein n=1 Tax=Saxibacter everestensis TaxID=2909229 RepID=A0ABY8QQ13_9MICO|nr:hypothetical protein LWF01_13260 [Brevibacteriaceae bacterium ZFBP1038]
MPYPPGGAVNADIATKTVNRQEDPNQSNECTGNNQNVTQREWTENPGTRLTSRLRLLSELALLTLSELALPLALLALLALAILTLSVLTLALLALSVLALLTELALALTLLTLTLLTLTVLALTLTLLTVLALALSVLARAGVARVIWPRLMGSTHRKTSLRGIA